MLPNAPWLVKIEVPKPKLVEGEHYGFISFAPARSIPELYDSRVSLVGLPPFGQPEDTSGDDEVDDAYDVPEIEREDLATPPDVLEPAPYKAAREPFDPGV
jgi:hypothetical protein